MTEFPDWGIDDSLSGWRAFRPEGLPLRQAIWGASSYCAKSWWMKLGTSPSIEEHFQKQRVIWSSIIEEFAPKDSLRVGLLGDLMWMRDGWKTFLHLTVRGQLAACDFVFGNLESPVSREHCVVRYVPDWFSYNSPPELISTFRREDGRSIFSALSLANNHVLDRDVKGAHSTHQLLQELEIQSSGIRFSQDERRWSLISSPSACVGFYAATWGLNQPSKLSGAGYELNVLQGLTKAGNGEQVDYEEVRQILQEMEGAGVTCRIVSLHWGHEFEIYPSACMMNVARQLAVMGVDIIVGHHPHVLQPPEVLFVNGAEKLDGALPCVPPNSCLRGARGPRRTLVLYSLGNFATAMYGFRCRAGAWCQIQVDATGQWRRPRLHYVYNSPPGWRRARQLVPLEQWAQHSPAVGNRVRFCDSLTQHVGQPWVKD